MPVYLQPKELTQHTSLMITAYGVLSAIANLTIEKNVGGIT